MLEKTKKFFIVLNALLFGVWLFIMTVVCIQLLMVSAYPNGYLAGFYIVGSLFLTGYGLHAYTKCIIELTKKKKSTS